LAAINNFDQIDIIVLGLYFPGIDIIKHFSGKGKKCVGIDCYDNVPGLYLRKVKTYHCPDPEKDERGWLDFLMQFRSGTCSKPVILNTSDKFIKAIIKNSKALGEFFLFHGSENGITEILMNKRTLVEYAESKGIPIPKTYFYKEGDDYQTGVEGFHYPCVIRPEYGKKWFEEPLNTLVKGHKLIKVDGRDELLSWMRKILPYDNNLIIQEIVVGPDENLFYSVCYLSKDNRLLGYFTGQKLRIDPVHFGSATYMRTHGSDEMLPLCRKIMDNSGYHGPAGIEFKKDNKDGKLKLIEINTRFGLWDVMGTKLGVNLFEIAYNDLTGNDKRIFIPDENITYYWMSIANDISVIGQYRKEGLLTWRQWIRCFFKKNHIADLYMDEPKMMYHMYVDRIIRKIRRGFFRL
jgi:predicted ATP-grasp superfamily ATP-dependent carboligase